MIVMRWEGWVNLDIEMVKYGEEDEDSRRRLMHLLEILLTRVKMSPESWRESTDVAILY